MLTEFEQQVQTTLRQRLPADVRDEVQVATGASNQRGILVGVRSAAPPPPEFSDRRPERVPGASDPRRVVRLRCRLEIAFVPANNEDREDMIAYLDPVLYILDAADIRDGTAFAGAAPDPGFLIHSLAAEALDLPLLTQDNNSEPLRLSLAVDGWFWPVGEVGESGVAIGEIRLRGVVLPVRVSPADPTLTAGGSPLALTILLDDRGTAQITEGALASLPFGNLAVWLEKEDGTAGEGSLSGGSAGTGGVRLLPLTDGRTEVTYTPPADPTVEILVVAVDDGENGPGLEIGRFLLPVGAAP